MQNILSGARLLLRNRSLWGYVARPIFYTALVFVGVLIGSYFLFSPFIARLMEWVGLPAGQSTVLSAIVFAVLFFLISGVLFVALAGMLSSLMWEKLSLEVEELAFGSAPAGTMDKKAQISDSMGRLVFSLVLAVLGVCCGWTFAGVPAIAIAGYLALHDFTAPAFLRRGVLFPQQRSLVFKLRDCWTFALGAGLISLFPFVNVLFMPALVAGGTLMVAKSQDRIGV
jgi:uncharacterized protein involved in cysteine biosynthesis